MPEREWFDLNAFLPSFLRIEQTIIEDPFIRDFKFRLHYNGVTMPLLPIEYMDDNMITGEY